MEKIQKISNKINFSFQLTVAVGAPRQTNDSTRPKTVRNLRGCRVSDRLTRTVTGHHKDSSLGHYDLVDREEKLYHAQAIGHYKIKPIRKVGENVEKTEMSNESVEMKKPVKDPAPCNVPTKKKTTKSKTSGKNAKQGKGVVNIIPTTSNVLPVTAAGGQPLELDKQPMVACSAAVKKRRLDDKTEDANVDGFQDDLLEIDDDFQMEVPNDVELDDSFEAAFTAHEENWNSQYDEIKKQKINDENPGNFCSNFVVIPQGEEPDLGGVFREEKKNVENKEVTFFRREEEENNNQKYVHVEKEETATTSDNDDFNRLAALRYQIHSDFMAKEQILHKEWLRRQ